MEIDYIYMLSIVKFNNEFKNELGYFYLIRINYRLERDVTACLFRRYQYIITYQ